MVVSGFHSEIREIHAFPEGLEDRWLMSAMEEFELEIGPLGYDPDSGDFSREPPPVYTLSLMMAKYYLKREMSRINKLNNILGKDLQLTGTGQSKAAARGEYESLLGEIERKLHKHKRHCYN
jgi:hypothetical protein